MILNKQSKTRLIGIIAIVFQVFALILISETISKGYELSIYANINPLAYLLLIMSVFLSILIVLYAIFDKEDNELWVIGYIGLIICDMIIICLPLIRNYVFYDFSDNFTHLGYIKDILVLGHFESTNFYPIMHIWISQISMITGISSMKIMEFSIPFISILFIVSIYLLSTVLFKERKIVILTTIVGAILFLRYTYYAIMIPNGFSFMFLPTVMYLYFKIRDGSKIALVILLIIFLILIPFSHPLTTVMLIVFLFVAEISRMIYSIKLKDGYKISFNQILISLVVFFTWISSYAVFNKSLTTVLLWLNGELHPITGDISSTFQKLNFSIYDQLSLILKMYGSNIFILILALIASLLIIKRFFSKDRTNDLNIFIILVYFVASAFMILVFLFTGNPNFEPIRSLNFVFLAAVPLAGYALYEILKRLNFNSFKKNIILKLVVVGLISISFVSALFVVYDSPYIMKPTPQLSQSHLDGMDWFYKNKNISIKGIRLEASVPWRFEEASYGVGSKPERDDFSRWKTWTTVPDHFGYLNNSYIGSNYSEFKYFPIATMDRLEYTKIWYSVNRYNETDFNRLNEDSSADKIYASGDLDIWLIKPYT